MPRAHISPASHRSLPIAPALPAGQPAAPRSRTPMLFQAAHVWRRRPACHWPWHGLARPSRATSRPCSSLALRPGKWAIGACGFILDRSVMANHHLARLRRWRVGRIPTLTDDGHWRMGDRPRRSYHLKDRPTDRASDPASHPFLPIVPIPANLRGLRQQLQPLDGRRSVSQLAWHSWSGSAKPPSRGSARLTALQSGALHASCL